MERSNDKEIEIAFLEARLRDMQNTLSGKPAMVARGVIEACGSNIKGFADTIPNSKASLVFDIQGRYKLTVEASSESDKLNLSLELPDGSILKEDDVINFMANQEMEERKWLNEER